MFLRAARPGEEEALTALCLRSKAVWGYDETFLGSIPGRRIPRLVFGFREEQSGMGVSPVSLKCPVAILVGSQSCFGRIVANILLEVFHLLLTSDDMIEVLAYPKRFLAA